MLKLAHPEALYFLLGLIPLGLLFGVFMLGRKKAIARMGEKSLVAKLMPQKPSFKHQFKFLLVALAYVFLVFAWANPQVGQTYEEVKRKGVDVIIALDISRSMLAEDIKPDRLMRSKQFISRLVDKLKGDRVGLIIFAGNAYLQVPITSDYRALGTFLKTINTNLAPTQGTAIGEAISLAKESFEGEEGTKRQHSVILVISDGENHEEDAVIAAKEAAEAGIVIHTMGVGSSKGSPIPVIERGIKDFKRDKSGSIVLSKLNETMLQEVAISGNGKYYRLGRGNAEANDLISELASMEQKEFEDRVFADYEDQFQWFLAIAIFLLTLEYFISERRSKLFTDWSIFKSNGANGQA